MKKHPVTTAIILETRKSRKDGKHPVVLRITYKRMRKYYTVQDPKGKYIALTKEEFEKVNGEKPRAKFKELSIYFASYEKKAIDLIESMKVFSFSDFEQRYYDKVTAYLIKSLKQYAIELRSQSRISTAVTVECTGNSLQKFIGEHDIHFESVTPKFLKEYERWMLKNNASLTTVGIYTRNIRTTYNSAISQGTVKSEFYPFTGKNSYQIPKGRNIKKALTQQEISILANFDIELPSKRRFRDYWVLSYLCNGMNIKDIALLKFKNLTEDSIHFIRAKTERETRKDLKNIVVPLTPKIIEIIERWRNHNKEPEQLVFPILELNMSPLEQYKKIQLTVGYINDVMKELAKQAGIVKPVTTYTARHSFATVLKRSGANISFISESLGHKSLQTTESYLADFEIEEKQKWANVVSNI
ncbi:Tyrosine recombinase XerC [bioreactor metagenome]|uniref:Tyrosine recombinase XerC n=1 Tax=bioreactor metagenome TaxID=1076179 RepID=A0A644TYV8_9ZZZZ|nr:tyrosine-type recombinase/integrase [Lentimicrobium sp.]MEA5110947.1 tyrosine-type recombinase/integrase [Lentimicrobium sp.]